MKVHIDTLNMVVRRLANQCPTRYWLDEEGDGSYTRIAVQIWQHPLNHMERLKADMEKLGFEYMEPTKEGRYVIYRWEVERDKTWEQTEPE